MLDNEMVRDIVLAVMASPAQVERARISDRTKAGLARVRAKGTQLGRPALEDGTRAKIADKAGEGLTPYAIAKRLGIDPETTAKYAAAAR